MYKFKQNAILTLRKQIEIFVIILKLKFNKPWNFINSSLTELIVKCSTIAFINYIDFADAYAVQTTLIVKICTSKW